MYKMKGCIPPMITPFKEDGELDVKSLEALVEFLSGHVHGVFINGSYGCGALMSLEERKRLGQNGRKYMIERFDRKNVINSYKKAIERIVKNGGNDR